MVAKDMVTLVVPSDGAVHTIAPLGVELHSKRIFEHLFASASVPVEAWIKPFPATPLP